MEQVSYKICKYTFSNISKNDKQKIGVGFFKISKYISFDIWKQDKQKIGPGFFNICKDSFS